MRGSTLTLALLSAFLIDDSVVRAEKASSKVPAHVKAMFTDCSTLDVEILNKTPSYCGAPKLLTADCLEKIPKVANINEGCRREFASSILPQIKSNTWEQLSKNVESFPRKLEIVKAFIHGNNWSTNPAVELVKHLMKDKDFVKKIFSEWRDNPAWIGHLLPAEVIKELPPKLCERLEPSVGSSLSKSSLSEITPECLAKLNPNFFTHLTPETWANTNPRALGSLTREQAAKLSPTSFAKTTPSQASHWGQPLPGVDAKETDEKAKKKQKEELIKAFKGHPCSPVEKHFKLLESEARRNFEVRCLNGLISGAQTLRPLYLQIVLTAFAVGLITLMI